MESRIEAEENLDPTADQREQKIGVVVVHGIGDPKPGESLELLTDSLLSEDVVSLCPLEKHQLTEGNLNNSHILNFFPMHVRRGVARKNANSLVFAEVYWGSASQLRRSSFGVLQGILTILLRSYVLIKHSTPPTHPNSRFFAISHWIYFWLARTISHLLVGPIFAVNIFFGLFILAVLACPSCRASPLDFDLAPLIGLILIFSITFVLLILVIDLLWKGTIVGDLVLPATWLLIFCIFWGSLIRIFQPEEVIWLLFIPAMSLIVFFILLEGGLILLSLSRGAHWLIFECFGNIIRYFKGQDRINGDHLATALFTANLQFGLWVILIPPLWAIILRQFEIFEDIESRVYGLVASTDGLQWTFVLAFILFSLLFTFARWLRTFFVPDATRTVENARGTWRLIINPWMNVCLNVII
ncbi:MAG: hypothetical protein AAGD96_33140, partial [Chloroflexota bacterium]